MNEKSNDFAEQVIQVTEVNVEDVSVPLEAQIPIRENTEVKTEPKKKLGIIGAVAAVLVILVIIVATLLTPSKFEKVADECYNIAGQLGGDRKTYFTIDTYPDAYEKMDELTRSLLMLSRGDVQGRALEAIKYANNELGFPGVYSDMLNTTALMGRQSEENDKYKVTWSYDPDHGLEVTYRKK